MKENLIGIGVGLMFYGGYLISIVSIITAIAFLLGALYATFTKQNATIINHRLKRAGIFFLISLLLFAIGFGGCVLAFSLDKGSWS